MNENLAKCAAFIVALLISTFAIGVCRAKENVTYSRDIQSIFVNKCLSCHGPDKSESGLRLDLREQAIMPSDSGETAIVPNDANASEILHRITTDDPDQRMPPEGDALAEAEVAALRHWIAQGAEYDQHWAFRPLTEPRLPTVDDTDWVRSEIDYFVLARLESAGIKPSEAADRYTLIKRLAYDLHGIPPSIQAVDDFVNDASPGAYERLVDRMLASPRFAERWTRHWLDKARYADSDGYEKDNHRPDAWRYRDWVIDAIQTDLPFDQFTIEQLAGDQLPQRDEQQLLATAFGRQTLTNTEGGTDREQWRVAAVMDRTETVGAVWLGLTVGCARCHNHKYDQITQKEYYELYAYFDNADESNASVPISGLHTHRYQLVYAEHQRRQEFLKQQLDVTRMKSLGGMPQWESLVRKQLQKASAEPLVEHDTQIVDLKLASGEQLVRLDDGSLLGDHTHVARDTYTLTLTCDCASDPLTGIVIETIPDDRLPKSGPGLSDNGNYVLTDLRVSVDDASVTIASAHADFSQADWHVSKVADGNAESGWAISPQMGKPHRAAFRFREPVTLGPDDLLRIVLDQQHKGHLIGRFRVRLQTGIDAESILPASLMNIIHQRIEQRASEERQELENYFLATDETYVKAKQTYDNHVGNVPKSPYMTTRVLTERQKDRRQTHILRRGEFKQKLAPVGGGTPAVLTTTEDPIGRLEFARWLVDGNPIVPRVAANQVWDHLFGFGLVRTMNDFGVRGEQPTHPQLLDWLASQYVRYGWSRKQLIRSVAMSATYRQASHHRDGVSATDPMNRLLYRQNRFRLEAEAVRDSYLYVAGLLSGKVGGASVFPPIPSGITDLNYNSSFKWKTSKGEDRYRRGMYTYFKRTAPHPNLTTLDCPDSNVTCVKRDRSNTPLAALITLNNGVFHEAAQAFARRVLMASQLTDKQRLALAFRRCVARPANDQEVAALRQLLETSRKWFADRTAEAEKLVGGYGVEGTPIEESAAWIATLRMVLNLDEFITRE